MKTSCGAFSGSKSPPFLKRLGTLPGAQADRGLRPRRSKRKFEPHGRKEGKARLPDLQCLKSSMTPMSWCPVSYQVEAFPPSVWILSSTNAYPFSFHPRYSTNTTGFYNAPSFVFDSDRG